MSDPTTPPAVLNPRTQAGIAVFLLVMFAGVLFLPAFIPTFKLDPGSQQVLMTLVTLAVGFYLGSSSSSANKDAGLVAAASAAIPPPVVNVIATPTALEPLEAAIAAQATPAPPPRASALATPPIAPAVPTLTDVLP